MRVLKIEPGKEPIVINIENTLESLQGQVGGYIETVTVFEDAALIVDEEGKLKGKPFNFAFCGQRLVGVVLAVGVDEEEFCDVPKAAEEFLNGFVLAKRRMGESDMTSIGERIRAARKAKGMTQRELAERTGYTSRSTIAKIEAGVNDIPSSQVASFADALGCTAAYLMGQAEEEGGRGMREILFRGKRISDGKWVYGAFSEYDVSMDERGEITVYRDPCIIDYSDELRWNEVDPETVGQYTGLTDKNDRKIFEGDVIECWSEGVKARGTVQQTIGGLWIIYPAWQKRIQWGLCPRADGSTDVEIIGNIHDNPEMMEEEEA